MLRDDEECGNNLDTLSGGAGHDEIRGGDGSDYILGSGRADELDGGVGADTFPSPAVDGADKIDGGPDSDVVDYSGRPAGVSVSLDDIANDGGHTDPPVVLLEHDDVRSTVERVRGGSGNDTIVGSSVGNHLYGGGGSDLLAGGLGADWFEGGPGDDTVSYFGYGAPVTVDLDGGSADDGPTGEHDTVGADLEGIIGGSGADKLSGNAAANTIRGGAGDDLIDGLGGSDQLFGEAGDDTVNSQDGLLDSVDCGDGADTTVSDPIDTRSACEFPPPPPDGATPGGVATGDTTPAGSPPPVMGPLVKIGPARLRLDRRGYARVRVSCPASAEQHCSGTLRLTRSARGKTRRFGSHRFSIASGRRGTVRIRVARRLRGAIGRRGVRASALASTRDAVSSTITSTRAVRILPLLPRAS